MNHPEAKRGTNKSRPPQGIWNLRWIAEEKLYQHGVQIAKTNFCVIKDATSTPPKLVVTLPPNHGTLPAMAPRPLNQSWSSPSPTMAHYNGTLRGHPAKATRPLHPAMPPCNGTQQWHHVHSTIAHYNGTLQRHPAMAPRPLNHSALQWHPAMAPSKGTTSTQP